MSLVYFLLLLILYFVVDNVTIYLNIYLTIKKVAFIV